MKGGRLIEGQGGGSQAVREEDFVGVVRWKTNCLNRNKEVALV